MTKLAIWIAVVLTILSGCNDQKSTETNRHTAKSEAELMAQDAITLKNARSVNADAIVPRQEDNSAEASGLSIWQKASIVLSDHPTPADSEELISSVLAAHNAVASDANVQDLLGALLRFRDQDRVNEVRVLKCMNSGVRSPTGSQWQDTMALCVTELAN